MKCEIERFEDTEDGAGLPHRGGWYVRLWRYGELQFWTWAESWAIVMILIGNPLGPRA